MTRPGSALRLAGAGLAALFLAAGLGAATAKATFAGGCFWCLQAEFESLPGVVQP